MKKILTLFSLLVPALAALATDYTDKLTVVVNGESTEQQTTITITPLGNDLYTLSLKNFYLSQIEDDGSETRLYVGNIVLESCPGTTTDGVTTIQYNDNIEITAGDLPDVPLWFGPMLGPIRIDMTARFNDTQLYTEIHIDLTELLEQIVDVTFGTEPDTAIQPLDGSHDAPVVATYGLDGQQLAQPRSGQIVLERTASGQTRKVRR